MKERMKKLTLLTFHSDKNRVTDKLHELGVLHIDSFREEVKFPEQEELRNEISAYKKAINILKKYDPASEKPSSEKYGNEAEIKNTVLSLDQKLSGFSNQIEELEKQKKALEPWGKIDWEKIKALEEHQVFFSFYKVSEKDIKKFDADDSLFIEITKIDNQIYLLIIDRIEGKNYPFEKVILPKSGIPEIIKQAEIVKEDIRKIEQDLSGLACHVKILQRKVIDLEDQLENNTVRHQFEEKAFGTIEVIHGWFPEKAESTLLKFISENELSFEFSDPIPGDKIPVILKNKKYPRLFENITRIFQLPDYYEFDLTPFIAVFFPIFFAYCLGDAGYGLILIVLSLISAFTFFKKMKGMPLLIGILGTVTAVLGIVKSGTLFGIPVTQHTDLPFFAFLSDYVLVTDDQDDIFNAFNVALMIGVFQILVAIAISIGKKIYFEGFLPAISAIGKFLIVGSLIILFLGGIQKMEIFHSVIGISKVFLITGVILVLLFHDTSLPIGARIGGGILPLYFIVTGLLGDVLSYIRLFALGVASSILGLVINQIGGQMMEGAGIIGVIVAILFLIMGHSLNFLLACLGSLVHPLRLTFVEFYNNANFTGGGVPYKPFKKHSIDSITK